MLAVPAVVFGIGNNTKAEFSSSKAFENFLDAIKECFSREVGGVCDKVNVDCSLENFNVNCLIDIFECAKSSVKRCIEAFKKPRSNPTPIPTEPTISPSQNPLALKALDDIKNQLLATFNPAKCSTIHKLNEKAQCYSNGFVEQLNLINGDHFVESVMKKVPKTPKSEVQQMTIPSNSQFFFNPHKPAEPIRRIPTVNRRQQEAANLISALIRLADLVGNYKIHSLDDPVHYY